MLGDYSLRPERKQQVSPCGRYIVMPDGSRMKRTVIPHPSKAKQAAADTEVEALLDEVNDSD